jgi:hypothetical protein
VQETNNSSEPKTERDKFIENLEDKLRKAGKAGRFSESEDGSFLRDFCTEQINAYMKIVGGTTNLENPVKNAYNVGQLHAFKKLVNIMDGAASEDTTVMRDQLEAAKNDDRPSA